MNKELFLGINQELEDTLVSVLKSYVRRLKEVKVDINEDLTNMAIYKINTIILEFKDVIKNILERQEKRKLEELIMDVYGS